MTGIQANANRARANLVNSAKWDHFTRLIVTEDNPRSLLVKYGFRYEWLNFYTHIIEEDLQHVETEQDHLPGPLFK